MTTKEIITSNPRLHTVHKILIGLIFFGIAVKIVYAVVASDSLGSAIALALFSIIISFVWIIVLIGLFRYQKWPYWILIFMTSLLLNQIGEADWLSLILSIVIQLVFPIYILYKISQYSQKQPPVVPPANPVAK
ncbi:MAG: hypothetical protein WC495_02055 [Patescibacteria group bacterium]|jgi:hypothetical protein